ncbi:MAG: PQQ-binding-like beta-propeller repeat protein [Thermoguttaceae bacterium]
MIKTAITSFLLSVFVVGAVFAAEPNWNQFRGPDHNNHSFSTGIAKEWNGEPKLLWQIDTLGAGYANLAFFGDKVYTMGDIDEKCCAIAFDKENGKILWCTPFGAGGELGRYYGPRATPAVDGENVFVYSQFGEYACLDAKTGEIKWQGNAPGDLGGKYQAMWGYASAPIFVDENVIYSVGGEDGTLIAFTKDGKQVWRSSEIKDPAGYATPVPVEIDGVKQLLLFTGNGVYGVDQSNGKKLWSYERPMTRGAACSDMLYLDGIALASTAYNIGSQGYKITKNGNEFKAEEIYSKKDLQNHHGGLILLGEYAYFTVNDGLVCMKIADGEVAWKNRSVGKGALLYVDGFLIVRAEAGDGTVALVEANPKEYVEKGRFDQPQRSDKNSWTYPVVVDNKLYLRDQNVLLVYELN